MRLVQVFVLTLLTRAYRFGLGRWELQIPG